MVSYDLYIPPFVIAFFICLGFLALLVAFSDRIKFGQRKEARHIHRGNISRLGGVALIISFVSALILDSNLVVTQQLHGVIIALGAILLVGVWDDFWQLHWKTQLFFQVAAVIFVFILGVHVEYVTNPLGGIFLLDTQKLFFPSLFFVVLWVTLLINSINWIDGVDGLSGGVTFVGAVTIFLLSLKPEVNQPPVAIIAAAFAGSILAFLVFNFNPARIFAGTSGSMFLGFVLAVLAIFAGAKVATALLVTAIPVIDALWVIIQRIKVGKPIFEADNFHLHHKLLELGWSQKQICLFFYAVTIVIGMIALNTKVVGKIVTISAILLLMVLVLFFVHRKVESLKNKKSTYA